MKPANEVIKIMQRMEKLIVKLPNPTSYTVIGYTEKGLPIFTKSKA